MLKFKFHIKTEISEFDNSMCFDDYARLGKFIALIADDNCNPKIISIEIVREEEK